VNNVSPIAKVMKCLDERHLCRYSFFPVKVFSVILIVNRMIVFNEKYYNSKKPCYNNSTSLQTENLQH